MDILRTLSCARYVVWSLTSQKKKRGCGPKPEIRLSRSISSRGSSGRMAEIMVVGAQFAIIKSIKVIERQERDSFVTAVFGREQEIYFNSGNHIARF